MALTGIISGIGGEGPQIEKGRERKRSEALENLNADLAIEQALENRRRTGIQESSNRIRLAQLQRLLQKDEEWKPVQGTVKQLRSGEWAQEFFQPSTGLTETRPIPAPDKSGFETPGSTATERDMGKATAYLSLSDALSKQGVSDAAKQQILDRFWPPIERMRWINTQEGMVGFSNLPGQPQQTSDYKGWPPGYGSNQPPPNPALDQHDWDVIGKLSRNEMTEDQAKKLYEGRLEPKFRIVFTEAMARGFNPNLPVTSTAAQRIANAQAQVNVNADLIKEIDKLGLARNNTPGYLMWARLKYGVGINTPGGLADDIANLQLTGITSAANALQGSSRAWRALAVALQHTPDVTFDSPQQIRRKLETIDQRLQEVINEERTTGTKSGIPNPPDAQLPPNRIKLPAPNFTGMTPEAEPTPTPRPR